MAAVIAADRSGLGALAALEQLLLGGEALPPALVDDIRPALRGRLLNMYGPTETTIWSTVSPIDAAGAPITIGRPIANTQVYIVDRDLQPNPDRRGRRAAHRRRRASCAATSTGPS